MAGESKIDGARDLAIEPEESSQRIISSCAAAARRCQLQSQPASKQASKQPAV